MEGVKFANKRLPLLANVINARIGWAVMRPFGEGFEGSGGAFRYYFHLVIGKVARKAGETELFGLSVG